MKLITWNIAKKKEAWYQLLDMDVDIALLQEAIEPPPVVASRVETGPEPWVTQGEDGVRRWRTAVVRLSNDVDVNWLKSENLESASGSDFPVSRQGTLSAAEIIVGDRRITLFSMYALWERPHPYTKSRWIYADASVHRLISDLSTMIGTQYGHRIIAAGDLNILHGYGDHGNRYWAARYETVFSRMNALGLSFVGPQFPNGRLADPWPEELPKESKNVPTYHTTRSSPEGAQRQLDFVFASNGIANDVNVRAINEPAEWGPSDHCRVSIEIR